MATSISSFLVPATAIKQSKGKVYISLHVYASVSTGLENFQLKGIKSKRLFFPERNFKMKGQFFVCSTVQSHQILIR